MKKNEVNIGNVYLVTVTGKQARVRITGKNPNGGWDGLNIDTKRKVRIKTAGRLQKEIADPDAPAAKSKRKAKKPADDAPRATQGADTTPGKPAADQEAKTASSATSGEDTSLTKLSVDELRQRYKEVIQRDTSSTNKAYLVWKLREAAKGRIPIGPRTKREGGDYKVLPLRMETNLVQQLDEARERLGLPSRMDLFRRSLHAFLLEAGEARVAELFAPTPQA